MYYQNKGHPIERRDHVFDFMTNTLGILIIVGCIMTILTLGWEFLRVVWTIYVSIWETLRITIFMINKLNIVLINFIFFKSFSK